MTKRIPWRLNWLLKVLNLFPDLLQLRFASDDALGNGGIVRFCAQCVELAKNFLGDEFQCAPDRLFAAQMMSELSEVTLEARQLLRDIGAVGKEGNFFENPFVVAGDWQPGLLNSVKQRGAIAFHRVGMKRADLLEFFPDRFETVNQILGQMFALVLPH